MPNEANVQRILEYLRQHAAQYNLETLRQQLLVAGHSADDIAAAIARYQQETASGTSPEIRLPPTPRITPSLASPTVTASASGSAAEIERVVAYLRQNQQQYNLVALRQQLLRQGVSNTIVDAAIRQVQASTPAAATAPTWPYGCLFGIGNYVALIVLIGVLAVIVGTTISEFGLPDSVSWGAVVGTLVGILLLETVVGVRWLRGVQQRRGKIMLFSVVFTVVGIVLPVLAFGICVALLTGAW